LEGVFFDQLALAQASCVCCVAVMPGLDSSMLIAIAVVFVGAIVRGFSGFGFSLLTITALSFIYTPAQIVPSIFLLEVAASIHLLPSIWKDIHWRSLLPLVIGCLIANPVGVWLLANVPAPPMQIAMALFVLVSVALMWRGFALKSMPGQAASAVAGAASGLANGSFGIGGPPVILFYFSSPAGNIAGRASLIAFFLLTDIIGLANQSVHGLITREAVFRGVYLLPPLIAGVWLGARSFKSADPEQFKRVVLILLAVMALLLAAKAIMIRP
jgi:uncharacterized protein